MLDGLSFPTIGDVVRQATVDFVDGTASSASTMVEGGTIDIEATSGDQPLVQTLANGLTDETSTDQFTSWGPWVNGLINSGCKRRACCRDSTWPCCRSRSTTAMPARQSQSANTPRSSAAATSP